MNNTGKTFPKLVNENKGIAFRLLHWGGKNLLSFLKDLGWLLAYYEKSYMHKTRLQVPEVQNQQTAVSGWPNQSGGKITVQTPLIQLPSYREEGYNGSVSRYPAELITVLCRHATEIQLRHRFMSAFYYPWQVDARILTERKIERLGGTTVTQNATLNFCIEYTFSFFWASQEWSHWAGNTCVQDEAARSLQLLKGTKRC